VGRQLRTVGICVSDRLKIGDEVRMRQRGGAVYRVYRITDVIAEPRATHRLFRLEADNGSSRTAWEDDLVPVQHAPHAHN
jgi:hypothetical protein